MRPYSFVHACFHCSFCVLTTQRQLWRYFLCATSGILVLVSVYCARVCIYSYPLVGLLNTRSQSMSSWKNTFCKIELKWELTDVRSFPNVTRTDVCCEKDLVSKKIGSCKKVVPRHMKIVLNWITMLKSQSNNNRNLCFYHPPIIFYIWTPQGCIITFISQRFTEGKKLDVVFKLSSFFCCCFFVSV